MIEYIKNNKLDILLIILATVVWIIALTTRVQGSPIEGGSGVHTHICGGCTQNIIDCFIAGCVCGCQCSGGCTHPSPLCTSPITSCTCGCRNNPQPPPSNENPPDSELASLLTAILYTLFNSNQQMQDQLEQLRYELNEQTGMLWITQAWSLAIAAFSVAVLLFIIFAILWSRTT